MLFETADDLYTFFRMAIRILVDEKPFVIATRNREMSKTKNSGRVLPHSQVLTYYSIRRCNFCLIVRWKGFAAIFRNLQKLPWNLWKHFRMDIEQQVTGAVISEHVHVQGIRHFAMLHSCVHSERASQLCKNQTPVNPCGWWFQVQVQFSADFGDSRARAWALTRSLQMKVRIWFQYLVGLDWTYRWLRTWTSPFQVFLSQSP